MVSQDINEINPISPNAPIPAEHKYNKIVCLIPLFFTSCSVIYHLLDSNVLTLSIYMPDIKHQYNSISETCLYYRSGRDHMKEIIVGCFEKPDLLALNAVHLGISISHDGDLFTGVFYPDCNPVSARFHRHIIGIVRIILMGLPVSDPAFLYACDLKSHT